jgi:hypothetical protein
MLGAETGPVDLLQTFGLPGLIIALMLMGWLWAKPAVDDLKDRTKRAEDQRDQMLKVYEDMIIPKLVATDEVLTSMKPVLLDVVRAVEQVMAEMGKRSP